MTPESLVQKLNSQFQEAEDVVDVPDLLEKKSIPSKKPLIQVISSFDNPQTEMKYKIHETLKMYQVLIPSPV